jgi:anti-sigma factor RsiW
MNCQRFQKELYEYLDEALSPAQMAAAKAHLLECGACRASVRREQQLAQSLAGALEQNAETIAPDAEARRDLAQAVQRKIAAAVEPAPIPWWRCVAMRLTATSPVFTLTPLLTALALAWFFFGTHQSTTETSRMAERPTTGAVLVNVSYCAPNYTFQRQGNMVIDALTCEARVVNGSLLAKN